MTLSGQTAEIPKRGRALHSGCAPISRSPEKKARLMMVYGAAFGMIINYAVPAHVVRGIITTVVTDLSLIFGPSGGPPALPTQI